MRRIVSVVVALVALAFVVIQLVPYGRDHANPPVTGEPPWNVIATRDLAVAACFDCHSNETVWPWYANIAPGSWIMQRHVDEGRDVLNFSTWGSGEQEAEEAAETVRNGEMPPWDYALVHPEARLSEEQKAELIAGLAATFGDEGGEHEGGEHEGGDD